MILLLLALGCWIAGTYLFLAIPKKWPGVRRWLVLAAIFYGLSTLFSYPVLGSEARLIGGIFGLYMFVGISVANPNLHHKRNLVPKERIREMRFGFYCITALALLSLVFTLLA